MLDWLDPERYLSLPRQNVSHAPWQGLLLYARFREYPMEYAAQKINGSSARSEKKGHI